MQPFGAAQRGRACGLAVGRPADDLVQGRELTLDEDVAIDRVDGGVGMLRLRRDQPAGLLEGVDRAGAIAEVGGLRVAEHERDPLVGAGQLEAKAKIVVRVLLEALE